MNNNLCMRFHQDLIILQTMEKIRDGQKQFLWGWKCRSGKTYGIGGLLIEMSKEFPILNTMIITPAPTETMPQFADDLFKQYIDFEDFNLIEIKRGSDFRDIEVSDGNNIILVSKQLLDDFVDEKKPIGIPNLDLIVFDENHFGGTTNNSSKIFDTYSSEDTIKLYLTATYQKPMNQWDIDAAFFWDIEDEQLCKSRNIDGLIAKHGKHVCDLLNKQNNIESVLSTYDIMPDLHIITTMMNEDKYEQIKQKIGDKTSTIGGFSMDVLFSLNNKEKNHEFNFPDQVSEILEYICGNEIYGKIKRVSLGCESRTLLDNEHFTTQLWFLPFGRGMHIDKVSNSLKVLMEKNKILSRFEIMIINSKNNKYNDLKLAIRQRESNARSEGKDGLILLAGNQCSLGITLPLVDIVLLLNNISSSDKIMQMMYRCMSEAEGKKIGFVIDLNISRVLNTILDYNVGNQKNNEGMTIEEKIKYIIENRLITIDDCMFESKDNNTQLINRLLEVWRSNPMNNFQRLLKKVEDSSISLDPKDQAALNDKFNLTIFEKKSRENKIKFDEEINQDDLPNGKETKVDDDEPDNNDNIESTEEENNDPIKEISITKDILPSVIPLCCILTMNDNETNLINMISSIGNDNMNLEIFNEQITIWWNIDDAFDLIHSIIKKYVKSNSEILKIALQCKMTLKASINKPTELLEFLESCLKPKQTEKRKYGEVFTPMKMVNEMLDRFDKYYQKKNGKSIFGKKNITWFDPANGMGNYSIAIYLRLMEGLKHKIPEEGKRKKHILENMIYMAELNKKNVRISRDILNPDGKYHLNLYQGNSLNLDKEEEWGIKEFDVIIGNPPYNEEFSRCGSARPLYNRFVEKFIDKCKYMTFIIPSRWFAAGRSLEDFREFMLKRKDLVYIQHYKNASDIFGKTVQIEGGINYFLKDSSHHGKVDFNGSKLDLAKYDVLVDSKYYELIDKVSDDRPSITDLYLSSSYFGINTNDKRLVDKKLSDSYIKCYVSQQKGSVKYIHKKYIEDKDYKFWKVITPSANGRNGSFGNILICKPNEVYSQTYISFKVGSETEAKSMVSYLRCRLPNLLLSLRKMSQRVCEITCKWIPIVPFNKEWNDESVYKYFGLSNNEIKLVKETKIMGYKELTQKKMIKIRILKK